MVSLGLAFVMTASMLAGCGSKPAADPGAGQEESSAQASDQAAEDSGAAQDVKTDDDAAAAEPITIQFWNSWTGADGELLTELVDEFNETNDSGITIEMDIMPSNDMSQKLATSVGAGTAAPLLLYNTAIKFSYGKEGELMNIDGIFDRTNLKKEDFDAEVLKLGEFDGTDYFIPMQASTYYFFWNKDLFEQAGLDPETPPATWDEYEEMAAKLTDPDRNIYRAMAGLSFGSVHARMTVLGNTDVFSSLGIFSGGFDYKTTGARGEGNLGVYDYSEIFRSPETFKKHLKLLFVGMGSFETDMIEGCRERLEELQQAGIEFEHHLYEGYHEWNVWRKCAYDMAQKLFRW